MINLIGLNGTMGCGKSEAFKSIQQAAGQREVVLVKFAQPLYDIQEFAYDRIKSVYSRPSTFVKDRKLLQWLGTDWGRSSIRDTVWVDIWKAEAEKHIAKGSLVVCDDVRFDNEATLIKSLGGKIVKILSNRTGERIDVNAGIKNHTSESGIKLDYVDVIVENNKTLKEYQDTLSFLCRELGVNVSNADSTESA